jgi:hypothetical protein
MDAEYFADERLTERAPRPMALPPAEYEVARDPQSPPAEERAFDAQDWVTLRMMDAYN